MEETIFFEFRYCLAAISSWFKREYLLLFGCYALYRFWRSQIVRLSGIVLVWIALVRRTCIRRVLPVADYQTPESYSLFPGAGAAKNWRNKIWRWCIMKSINFNVDSVLEVKQNKILIYLILVLLWGIGLIAPGVSVIVPEIIIVIYIFFIQFLLTTFFIQFLLWPYAVYLSKKEIFKNQILNLFIIAVFTTLGFILFLFTPFSNKCEPVGGWGEIIIPGLSFLLEEFFLFITLCSSLQGKYRICHTLLGIYIVILILFVGVALNYILSIRLIWNYI